jgi:vacuolar protein sorting-associated protein 13A/C
LCRIENRTWSKTIQVKQSGLQEEAWIYLEPRTTKKFSLENPYGSKVLEVGVRSGENISIHSVNLERPSESSVNLREKDGIQLHIIDVGDLKVLTFMDERNELHMGRYDFSITTQKELRSASMQFEVIVELGVVGVSLIDHRPKELLYLHLQRVFISYLTGTISRQGEIVNFMYPCTL